MDTHELLEASRRSNGKNTISVGAAKHLLRTNGHLLTKWLDTDMTPTLPPLSLSTRFKRAAGAQEFGGAATQRLIALPVDSSPDRQAAAGEEITLEQIGASAVAELVSQVGHFRLDGDVLRALQTHESTSDSAQSAAARPTASPQSAADR